MSTTNAKASIIPTNFYRSADTRAEGAEIARQLSKKFPNVPFALMTYFAQDRCYVEVYRQNEHAGDGLFHKADEAGLYCVYINGRRVRTRGREVEQPPKVKQHRLIVCIDFLVPEDHPQADAPDVVGADLLAKALKEGNKADGDTERCLEYPNFWLDPEEEGAVVPKEWGDETPLYEA